MNLKHRDQRGRNTFVKYKRKAEFAVLIVVLMDTTLLSAKKPRDDKEVKEEAHIAQFPDEEPALLLVEKQGNEKVNMLIDEERMNPSLN